MDKSGETEWLRRRLDAIIRLLVETQDGAAAPQANVTMQRLLGLGFTQAEVAQMTGKKTSHVSSVVAKANRKKGKKPKKQASKGVAEAGAPTPEAGGAT